MTRWTLAVWRYAWRVRYHRWRGHKPQSMPEWRWVLGKLWLKVLWYTGFHWKKRQRQTVTVDLLKRRIRHRMREDHVPWSAILRKDPCAYCQRTHADADVVMTLEHVLPRSRKGRDISTNLVGACFRCNHWRGSKPLLLFLLERQGWIYIRKTGTLGYTVRQREPERVKATLGDMLRARAQPSNQRAALLDAYDKRYRQPSDVDLRKLR